MWPYATRHHNNMKKTAITNIFLRRRQAGDQSTNFVLVYEFVVSWLLLVPAVQSNNIGLLKFGSQRLDYTV